MDRTSASGYATDVNGHRVFQNANPAASIQGTSIDATDTTAWQEEIMGLIEGSGQVGTSANVKQALAGVKTLAGANVTALIASATLTLAECGLVEVSAAAGSVTLTLPAPTSIAGGGFAYRVTRTDSGSANTVTIAAPAGADILLGGASTPSVTLASGQLYLLLSDGTNYVGISGTPSGRYLSTTVVTSSGTITPPALWAGLARVRMVGGGGGGGGVPSIPSGSATASMGGGGGAGGYIEAWLSAAQFGASQSVIIGAGGAGGAAGVNFGATGGTTSLGSLLTCQGGGGGASSAATSYSAINPGGGGGAATATVTTVIQRTGDAGNDAILLDPSTNLFGAPGYGGGSPFGQGASGGTGGGGGNYAGLPGGPGAGGAGASAEVNSAGYAGGSGGSGMMIIEWYS